MKTIETTGRAELLSALHDGQLDTAQALALVRASLADDSLMQQWRSMSTISAALASNSSSGSSAPAAPRLPEPSPAVPLHTARQEAANDGLLRWKMVAGFAALAAVGSLVWGLVGQQAAPAGAVLAQQSFAPSVAAAQQGLIAVQERVSGANEPQVMIRDPRLDELMAAHKQFGGMSALQQPAGSLRSASLVSNRP